WGFRAAGVFGGYTVDFFGWDGGFMVMIGGSVLAVILLVIVMLGERRHHQQLKQA
nr:glycerol-3-phosphate transporter [Klebsiella pneumoniae]